MFLLYHSKGCNICESVIHECYVNDFYTATVVYWVTASVLMPICAGIYNGLITIYTIIVLYSVHIWTLAR
jgi:hypothetical protein